MVYTDAARMKAINQKFTDEIAKDESNWIRFRIVFLNMVVSSSFLAGYSMQGFYFLVIMGISALLTPICMFTTTTGWLYELTHGMVFLKLIDAVYMGRHERNLNYEEETWRML